MNTDLLLDSEYVSHGDLSLTHVFDGFHEETCVGALLCHQADDVHFVNLVANLELVKL